MPNRPDPLPASLPPYGLSRPQAAAFVGVSVGTFDAMVDDGRMPKPKRIGTRKVWARKYLEDAFFALPEDGADDGDNPCDRLLA